MRHDGRGENDGWKGVGTRSEYYLKRTQNELKEAVDKLVYLEEELHLQEWKDIIKDRYGVKSFFE